MAEPGTLFVYSNASAFILSVFLQELTGESLYNFARRVLFSPLNIESHSWKKYGEYSAGATGLRLCINDLHKLGRLMLNRGLWDGTQVVSTEFIDDMSKRHVRIEKEKWRNLKLSPSAYGYFIWIGDRFYFINGAGGQLLIVMPQQEVVVSIFSTQSNTSPLLGCIGDHVWP